jgi:hypothetical protein
MNGVFCTERGMVLKTAVFGQSRKYCLSAVIVLLVTTTVARAAEENPFDANVLEVRPRIFLRDKGFDGLTIEKLRTRMNEPGWSGSLLLQPYARCIGWSVRRRPRVERRER